MNSNNGVCDIANKLANTDEILEELSNSIEQGVDVGQLVKLAFHFGMKEKESLAGLLDDFSKSYHFNEKERGLTTDLIRRMASVKLINIDGKKHMLHTCVLPIVVRSHYGSHVESVVLPSLVKVNLEARLQDYVTSKGVSGKVDLLGTIFQFESYQPDILDYVNYAQYLSDLCVDDVYVQDGANNLFLMPFTILTEVVAGKPLFSMNTSVYDVLNNKYTKDPLPEVKQILNFVFKASKYTLTVCAPMLSNEGLWGTLSFLRMENCLSDIAKQAIIASPSDYRVFIVNDSSCNAVRLNFYIGNENFYSFDYGSHVNFNMHNDQRDISIIRDYLQEHGFKCSVIEGKINGSLDEEVERGMLSLCVI